MQQQKYLAAPVVVKEMLEKNKDALAQALPRHMPVEKIIRIAFTQLQKNKRLQECTQFSFVGAVLESAFYGLEPDGREAALVPYKVRGVMTCTFQPMYRGLIKLARNSGDLALIYSEIVREGDDFEMEKGLEPKLRHRPNIEGRGKPRGGYAVYRLKSGEADFAWMSVEEIEKIRKRSKAANDGPWVTDWDEMAKKTLIKRVLKVAPSSVERMVDNPESRDVVFKGLETLSLPTPEEEAEGSIEEPRRLSGGTKESKKPGQRPTTGPAPKKEAEKGSGKPKQKKEEPSQEPEQNDDASPGGEPPNPNDPAYRDHGNLPFPEAGTEPKRGWD